MIKNEPAYLAEEPYRVYNELIKSKSADRKTAGAILCFLVSEAAGKANDGNDAAELSNAVQKECGFNKRLADRLAEIIPCPCSSQNRQTWAGKDGEGLRTFLDEEFAYTWKGFAVWDEGNGTVDCSYEANIVLKPTEEASKDKELTRLLKKIRLWKEKKYISCSPGNSGSILITNLKNTVQKMIIISPW